jgi:hypothetical protein
MIIDMMSILIGLCDKKNVWHIYYTLDNLVTLPNRGNVAKIYKKKKWRLY